MRFLAAGLIVLAPAFYADAALAAGGGSGNGVHVDPGSPSQHQYVLPISAARAETAGGKHSKQGSGLFGSGITASSGTPKAKKAKGGATTPSPRPKHGTSTKQANQANVTYSLASNSHPPTGRESSAVSTNGGSGWLPLAGGGALVLLLGGGGGLALRRRMLRT